MSTDEPKGDRIAKLLARAGIASRREVERMITEGRVKLDDAVITTPATILHNLKGVTVDGNPVKAAEPPRLFAFHKPDGLITAERDPAGRPTIYTALRNALPPGTPRLMPVGRLDLNTEGLLLLTNDGELKRAMELPSSGIPRTYRARTFGDVTQNRLEELIEGVTIEGMNYGRIDANMERSAGRNKWIELTLTEGKNREVRRVLEYLGLQVSRLLRTRYGPFYLDELQRGSVVEIRQKDVEMFRKTLRLEPSARAGAGRAAPGPAPHDPATSRAPSRAGARSASRADARADTRQPAPEKAPVRAKLTAAPDPKAERPRRGPARTGTGRSDFAKPGTLADGPARPPRGKAGSAPRRSPDGGPHSPGGGTPRGAPPRGRAKAPRR